MNTFKDLMKKLIQITIIVVMVFFIILGLFKANKEEVFGMDLPPTPLGISSFLEHNVDYEINVTTRNEGLVYYADLDFVFAEEITLEPLVFLANHYLALNFKLKENIVEEPFGEDVFFYQGSYMGSPCDIFFDGVKDNATRFRESFTGFSNVKLSNTFFYLGQFSMGASKTFTTFTFSYPISLSDLNDVSRLLYMFDFYDLEFICFTSMPKFVEFVVNSQYNAGFSAGLNAGSEEAYNAGFSAGYSAGKVDGENRGKLVGYDLGFAAGYSAGLALGEENSYNVGYEAGRLAGLAEGFDEGYIVGNQDGFDNGIDEGYQNGYDSGYSEGNGAGYSAGYNVGFAEGNASDSPVSFLSTIIGGVVGLLNIQILPNFTIGALIMIPMILGLFFWLFKLIKGGD